MGVVEQFAAEAFNACLLEGFGLFGKYKNPVFEKIPVFE